MLWGELALCVHTAATLLRSAVLFVLQCQECKQRHNASCADHCYQMSDLFLSGLVIHTQGNPHSLASWCRYYRFSLIPSQSPQCCSRCCLCLHWEIPMEMVTANAWSMGWTQWASSWYRWLGLCLWCWHRASSLWCTGYQHHEPSTKVNLPDAFKSWPPMSMSREWQQCYYNLWE